MKTAVALLLSALAAFAQTSGTISGAVSDESGARVPGAKIVASNATTGEKRETVSAANGQYVLPFLPPGEYRIEVTLTGFGQVIATAVLGVTERVAVDITLKPAAVAEKVEVTSATPLLQTESAALGRVVDGTAVKELPLSSRNFTQLLALSPGTSAPLNDLRGRNV